MSYDTKCYELAKAFLEDVPAESLPGESRALAANELAQEIQDTIESFFEARNLP